MTCIAIIGQEGAWGGGLGRSLRGAVADVAFWRRGDGAAQMEGSGKRGAKV